jgi:hypothetical protein
MNWPNNTCDPIWEHADWLPPEYILDRWCQQDARCRYAKQQALLSACERGDVYYRRSDGKTFDDPIHELSARGILLIDRDSFDAWATTVDGQSPLPSRPRKKPPYPGWAAPGTYRFDEEQWEWVPVSSPPPVTPPAQSTDSPPRRPGPPPAWVLEMRAAEAKPVAISVDEPPADAGPEEVAEGSDEKPNYDTYPSEDELRKLGVPADEIVAAFQLEDTRHKNEKWWRERMGNVSRANKSLGEALVQKGLPNRGAERYPSWWRPDLVARWLIDTGHLGSHKVAPVLRKEFPKWAKLFDEQ